MLAELWWLAQVVTILCLGFCGLWGLDRGIWILTGWSWIEALDRALFR